MTHTTHVTAHTRGANLSSPSLKRDSIPRCAICGTTTDVYPDNKYKGKYYCDEHYRQGQFNLPTKNHHERMLAKGTNQEAKEHPTFTLTQAMTIAKDHLRENPHYYDKE